MAPAPAIAQPPLAGLSLEEAIGVLEDAGLRVFYSSDLVKPGMRVLQQPSGGDARDWLRTVLAPHDLTIEPGPRGSLLIVAAPVVVAVSDAAAAQLPPRVAEPRPPAGPQAIEEIVVAGSRYELARAVDAAPFRLVGTDLEALPDLGDDSLRAMQRLPGTAANGVSARANVRGGEVGETLVRLDQLRLYEPYHLEDFQAVFSSIDPRIVSSMEVYTGGFPAAFGDRMSGVIDVASLVPPAPRYHELAVSFFNASALSAGRFAGDDGEWLASVRRSNLDLLYSAFSAQPERPRYLDAFAKLAYRLNDSLRVSVNALYSHDDVTLSDDLDAEERARSSHEDRYAWLRFEHSPSAALAGATLLAHTTLSGERSGQSDKEGLSRGWLTDLRDFTIDSLQSEWTWQPAAADRWQVQFGGLIGRSSGRYDYRDAVEFDLLFDAAGAPTEFARERSVSAAPSGAQHALYGSLRYRPSARLTLGLGARWDHQTLDPGNGGSLGPRFALSYRVGERTLLRASGGRFEQSQAINELQVNDGVQQFFAPQHARHSVLAVEHDFSRGVHLRVEAYEKEMHRLRPRYESLLHSLTLLPELKPDRVRVDPDSAAARGVEVLVTDGRAARLDWWASYGYGWVRDRIAALEEPRSWDQTHTLSGGLSFETLRWSMTLAATYHSGWPTTAALGLRGGDGEPVVVTGPRNGEHVAAFRTVDLRVARMFALQRSELSVFFELSNAFDHRNDCCNEYEIAFEPSGEPWLELSPVAYFSRVPSIGFVWAL